MKNLSVTELLIVSFVTLFSKTYGTEVEFAKTATVNHGEIFHNCCAATTNSSCIEENSPILAFQKDKQWMNVNERYTYEYHNKEKCSENSTLVNVTVRLADFQQKSASENENSSFPYNHEENTTHFVKNILVHDERYYTSNEYCVSKADENNVDLNICQMDCESVGYQICIPKCCPPGQSLNISEDSLKCLEDSITEKYFRPAIYLDEFSAISHNDSLNLNIHYYSFNCSSVDKIVSQNRKIEDFTKLGHHGRIRLLKNGVLKVRTNTWATYSRRGKYRYCLESLHNEAEVTLAVLCKGNSPSIPSSNNQLLSAINIIEGLFTLITTVIYLLLWRKLRNTHRLTQFFHVTSYGLLLLMKSIFFSGLDIQKGGTMCTVLGIVLHYLLLATGSWMVIINLDLFLMFWKMRRQSTGRSRKQFFYLCVYGWVSPLIPIIIGLCLEAEYKYDNDTSIAIPEYGKYQCFISAVSFNQYFFIPLALDYVIVLVLFFTTAKIIYKHKQSTTLASSQSNAARRYRGNGKRKQSLDNVLSSVHMENFRLFLKLAVLSGLLGVLDILLVLPEEYRTKWKTLYSIHKFMDHILGFALFYIYVCNKSTLKDLKSEYKNVFHLCWRKDKGGNNTGGQSQYTQEEDLEMGST